MDWRDVDGHRFELSWIEDTGELYLMSESDWTFIPGPGAYYSAAVAKPQALVIATIPSEVEVDSLLKGWRDAMNVSLGVGWVMDRIDGRADSTI